MKSALGDGEIMQKTVVRPDNTFCYTFPSGETLVSDPIPPDKRKAGVITAWCDAVRAKDIANQQSRAEENAARKRRRKAAAAPVAETPAPPGPVVAPATEDASSSDDPDHWVRVRLERSRERLASAEREFAAAQKQFKKFERLAVALGIEEEKGEE